MTSPLNDATHPGALGVTTWNALADSYLRPEYYPHLDTLPAPASRRERCVEVLAAAAARSGVLTAVEVEASLAEAVRERLGGRWALRWEPRGGTRADGTLVAARVELAPVFAVGRVRTGDFVWAAVEVTVGEVRVQVVGAHLGWAPPGTDPSAHPGMVQLAELADQLNGDAVITGDLNDRPDGPVIAELRRCGFNAPTPPAATAVVNGAELVTIDWIAGRGRAAVSDIAILAAADRPIPDEAFPSDHVPVFARITT